MSGIITARTTISADELTKLYRQGDSVGLTFAKEKGLVHDIREAKVPSGTPFIACNFT
jgi:hypothetical protein